MAWTPGHLLLATTCAAIWAALSPCEAFYYRNPGFISYNRGTMQMIQQQNVLRTRVDLLQAQLRVLQDAVSALPPVPPPPPRCFRSPPAPDTPTEPVPDLGASETRVTGGDDSDPPLHAAAARDDVSALLAELRRGARLDERDAHGDTALHAAAREGAARATRALLTRGADFHARGQLLRTPLHAAAARGQVETARLLVEAGADPAASDARGDTALTLAARANRAALAEWLLERAPAAEWVDAAGDSALLAAARAGRWARAERLAAGGAAPAVRGRDGVSPLRLAARAGAPALAALQAMVRGGALCGEGEVASALAEANGAPQVWAIAQAAPGEVVGGAGQEALRQAARDGRASALAALLAAGVDPTLPDAGGRAALELAARAGHAACVEALAPAFARRPDLVLSALNATDDARVIQAMHAVARPIVRSYAGTQMLTQAARDGRCEFFSTLMLADDENKVLDVYLRLTGVSHITNCLPRIVQKILSSKNQTAEVERFINDNRNSDVLEIVAKAVPDVFLAVAGENAFMRSVEGNRCYMIRPIVAAGSDPKQNDARDALALAVGRASVDCVRALREGGVPGLDAPLYDDMLRNASATCGAELLEALLAAGVDPTRADADGRTALQLALRAGHVPCVQTLVPHFANRSDLVLRALNDSANAKEVLVLAAGARRLIQSNEGDDFLKRIVRDGRCSVAEALLTTRNKRQQDAAMVLTQPGANVECVESVLNGFLDIDKEKEAVSRIMLGTNRSDILEQVAVTLPDAFQAVSGNTALTDAVKAGKCYLIRPHIASGVSPGARDAHQALEAAAEMAHLQCVKALRQEGVAPLADERWQRMLRDAGAAGWREKVEALLSAGVPVDAADEDGRTPLMLAALNGHADTVVDLLNAGADKDRPQQDGITALMLASREGHLDVVLKLLHVHAQVDAKSEQENTALMLASLQGHVEVVRTLLHAHAKVDEGNIQGDTPLILACWKGRTDVVHELLEASANVDWKNERSDTALIVAAHYGYTNIVSLLLKANAQVNISNKSGVTALIHSSLAGHLEVVKLLLNAHADVNMKTTWGSTALISACSIGNLQIVNLLLEHNADITVRNNVGKTAFDVASDGGYTEIMKVLNQAVGSDN